MNKGKITAFAWLIVLALGFMSCEKEYTCQCRADYGGNTDEFSVTSKQLTKIDAKEWCDEYEQSAGILTTSCFLK